MASKSQVLIDIGQGLSLMVGLLAISSWKTQDRPERPKLGTFGFNLQTNSLEYWNGTNWFAAQMSEG